MRKKNLLLILICVLCLMVESIRSELNLMPMPASITEGEGKFRITTNLRININSWGSSRLFKAAFRFIQLLDSRTGLFTKHEHIKAINEYASGAIQIFCNRVGKLEVHEDEHYILKVEKEGISIEAETDIGALRAFQTLVQLLDADQDGYFFPQVLIDDKPRFTWRGLMLDPVRHWMPLSVVLRNIEGMEMVKMNVLHLHLCDDQGFRVESKQFPLLHEKGSDGNYFTQDQIKQIIKFASDRGIRVVPEFDIPGHTTSWLVGYPEFGSIPGPFHLERTYTSINVMNVAKPELYEFLKTFLGEMCALFPDNYFHIGGDEVNPKQWNENEEIQEFMKSKSLADAHELQAYFNKEMHVILTSFSKKLMGWDEILNPSLPKSILIQSWRGTSYLIEAAEAGYECLLSRGYYLDLIYPTTDHYLNDPIPFPTPLTPAQQELILGGESCMWAEHVTPENVDSRIWPRNAAIAERLWSPQHVIDVDSMYTRLDEISWQLEGAGLTHIKNYNMMLRRLTASFQIQELKTLIDIVEPPKGYLRNRISDIDNLCPYSRCVDASVPDQKRARIFRQNMQKWMNDYSMYQEIKSDLEEWSTISDNLKSVIDNSPILHEIRPLAQVAQELAISTFEMMKFYEEKTKPSEEQLQKYEQLVKNGNEYYGECILMIVEPIGVLVEKLKKF